MKIVELATGLKRKAVIRKTTEKDFRFLTAKRFSFAWKNFKRSTAIYKLQIADAEEILGVIGLIDIPGDKRIEIKLLATSIENKGKTKVYDRIAGCLIAFACSLAVKKYGEEACVSLIPKTALITHYTQKYGMLYAGWQLYIEGQKLKSLLKEYSND